MEEEYIPEIIEIQDENGNTFKFEVLDRIEDDDGKYIALVSADDVIDSEEEEAEVFILQVDDTGDDETSSIFQIADPKKFEEIAKIFEERLFEEDE